MKALVPLFAVFCACAFVAAAQQRAKPSGEEGRIIALESAWDQAEQNKDVNALTNILADDLVYVDYDGSISTKQQFLADVKRESGYYRGTDQQRRRDRAYVQQRGGQYRHLSRQRH